MGPVAALSKIATNRPVVVAVAPPAQGAWRALTWSLVVCTRNREQVLIRALRLALSQTRKPSEVVIVDSSRDWEASRDRVRAAVQPPPGTPWTHVGSARGSLPHQRNIAIGHTTADILFMLDDDTLMYPDCAEEIMHLYESDAGQEIAGITTLNVPVVPEDAPPDAPVPTSDPARQSLRARLAAWLTGPESRFIPYDKAWPECKVPASISPGDAVPARVMCGFRMTYRREVIARLRFSENLEGYSIGEDYDASYRVSRVGAVLLAKRARVHHLVTPGGRPNRPLKNALSLLNVVLLTLEHTPPHLHPVARCRRFLLKRVLVAAATDLGRRRFSFPDLRGTLLAWRHARELFARREPERAAWYLALQRTLLQS